MKFYRNLPLAAMLLLAQPPVPFTMPAAPAPALADPAPGSAQGTVASINYRLLASATRIDFHGTTLAPEATGQAKVKTKDGISTIKAKFSHLPAASTFGEACLTYVLWAVSPEGQTANLGELQVQGGKGKLKVTEQLPDFGLMVTAEPYFAVTRPSDAVVLKNAIGRKTKGDVEVVEAKLSLVPQRQYGLDLAAAPPPVGNPEAALPMLQARQAVRIALGAGAASYAKEPLGKAQNYLQQSEAGEGGAKGTLMSARSATQSAEEARLMAVHGKQAEQEAMVQKLAQAKLEQAKAEAATAAAAQEAALKEAQATTKENEDLRTQLMAQLNGIMETKATARGLIVSMSGVLFRTGQAKLVPAAREKLAKVAGILASHKGLKIEANGFTDSTGREEINARLSESRAQAARDFLVSQGVAPEAIVSKGFGAEHPIADNGTVSGRQENRRVELVVSGEGLTPPEPSEKH
jgi:outer membrane protein OmpA-like peptidoglycan-associated protein